jgi:hypothetical protein
MLLQAAGFAVLAALSPTALLITAIYLGSARPRTTALCYLAGAVLISTVMGIAVLLLGCSGSSAVPDPLTRPACRSPPPSFPCLRAHPGQRASILRVN